MTQHTPSSWRRWLVQRLAHGPIWANHWQHPLQFFGWSYSFLAGVAKLRGHCWRPPGTSWRDTGWRTKLSEAKREEKCRAGVLKTCLLWGLTPAMSETSDHSRPSRNMGLSYLFIFSRAGLSRVSTIGSSKSHDKHRRLPVYLGNIQSRLILTRRPKYSYTTCRSRQNWALLH